MRSLIQLSGALLLAVRKEEPTHDLLREISAIPFARLLAELCSDEPKKAFWINLYNAGFLILRRDHRLGKPQIYREKHLVVGGRSFSLDDIEHGILRRYRLKWALGYLPDPFVSSAIRQLAVSLIDYRIHFALNCGAKSCPPIGLYLPEKIEDQLEMATRSFLHAETEICAEKREVWVSRLFLWFRGDFARAGGVRRLIREKLEREELQGRIRYRTYDRREDLNNFRDVHL